MQFSLPRRRSLQWLKSFAMLGLAIGLTIPTLATARVAELPTQTLRGLDGRLIPLEAPADGALVLVFYSTECPISNQFSPILNEIAQEFDSKPVRLIGICVDPDLTDSEIQTHAEEYALAFPVARDRFVRLANAVGVKMVPEATVFDDQGDVRYQGRINDLFFDRGKKRTVSQTDDLRDAIAAVLSGQEIADPYIEAIGCFLPSPPRPDDVPTYAEHVAPIVQNHCMECHRPGQIGPFPLTSYEQASKRALDLAVAVEERRMPPWKPAPGVGPRFKHDRSLTDDEIAILVAWADGGAPAGDLTQVPPAPEFSDGWALGTPDLVLEMREDFEVPASGKDIYRCFVLPTDLDEDTYVTAIEFQPGNPRVVHHLVGFVNTDGQARQRDEETPGEGYDCFGGAGVPTHGSIYGVWAPGIDPWQLPEGVGQELPAGSDYVMQVHYHPSGKEETDRSRVGLHFAKRPIQKAATWHAAGNFQFEIPPGETNYEVRASWELPVDAIAYSAFPHMHLIGKDIKMSVTYPDGRTQTLIEIPRWDFNWQYLYDFDEPIFLPKGTVLDVVAHYDNSAENPFNPSSPPRPVTYGEATTDEMCIGLLSLAPADQDLTQEATNAQQPSLSEEE